MIVLRTKSHLLIGMVLVVLGLTLTVLAFGIQDPWSVQRFWPLLVMGFGASHAAARPRRAEGWILLLVGGAVQLANTSLFAMPGAELVRYWPLAVVLPGFSEMAFSRSVEAMIEGIVVVALGVWLQLSYFGLTHISSYPWWPLVLAATGGVMLWRGLRRRPLI